MIEAVIEHITVLSKSAELSFAVTCINLQKAKDRHLPEDLEQPAMMIAVCPVEPRPLRVDIVAISELFQRLDSLTAFTRLKGGRDSLPPLQRFLGGRLLRRPRRVPGSGHETMAGD